MHIYIDRYTDKVCVLSDISNIFIYTGIYEGEECVFRRKTLLHSIYPSTIGMVSGIIGGVKDVFCRKTSFHSIYPSIITMKLGIIGGANEELDTHSQG